MIIQNINEDILENKYKIDIICQGCNCLGVMGAGLAAQIKRKYPNDMFRIYNKLCELNYFQCGVAISYDKDYPNIPILFNLGTQYRLGKSAKLAFVNISLINMRRTIDTVIYPKYKKQLNIAFPRIGCGIGGLKWADVKKLILGNFSSYMFGNIYLFDGF